jgi:hypothetical protein
VGREQGIPSSYKGFFCALQCFELTGLEVWGSGFPFNAYDVVNHVDRRRHCGDNSTVHNDIRFAALFGLEDSLEALLARHAAPTPPLPAGNISSTASDTGATNTKTLLDLVTLEHAARGGHLRLVQKLHALCVPLSATVFNNAVAGERHCVQ